MSLSVLEVCIRGKHCEIIQADVLDRETFGCTGRAHLFVSLACSGCSPVGNILNLVSLQPSTFVDAFLASGVGFQRWVEKIEFQRSYVEDDVECRALKWPIHEVESMTILGPQSIEIASLYLECGNLCVSLTGFPPNVTSVNVEGRFKTVTVWGFWRVRTPVIEVHTE